MGPAGVLRRAHPLFTPLGVPQATKSYFLLFLPGHVKTHLKITDRTSCWFCGMERSRDLKRGLFPHLQGTRTAGSPQNWERASGKVEQSTEHRAETPGALSAGCGVSCSAKECTVWQ